MTAAEATAPVRRTLTALALALALTAGLAVAAPSAPVAAAPSRCSASGILLKRISCSHSTTVVWNWGAPREVHWQVPVGTPPAGGWPTVLMFQGSFFTAELTWSSTNAMPFGAYHQTDVVRRLLDRGYAVITPEAHIGGSTFWDTNVPPWSLAWTTSPDHAFMTTLFSMIDARTFGPLDGDGLFATGISSGGYMASRMALAYPERFRAVAIQSASYAACSGPLCVIPSLPSTHAPTLFLHGSADVVVPVLTARAYDAALRSQGTPTRFVSDLLSGHEWIRQAPAEVPAWFDRYR